MHNYHKLTRRTIFGVLLAAALLPTAHARRKASNNSGASGGSSGGCGGRGGPGYRKSNGKCASHKG